MWIIKIFSLPGTRDFSLDCVDMSQMKFFACFITVLFILELNMVSYRGVQLLIRC